MTSSAGRFNAAARLLVLLALLLPVLAACGPAAPQAAAPQAAAGEPELKGTLTVSGAFALYPMMVKWGEEFTKLHPGVQFDISAGGAGKGMADVLAGAADIGMVSREVSKDEEGKGAWWAAVTKDAVLPMVNADNPVLADLMAKGVTKEQFAKIYMTGELKTWGELVGRPEVADPIDVYTRSDAAGAPETWAKYLGGKQENLQGIAVFGDPGLLDAVVKDKLGIGFNNLAYAFDGATGKPVAGAVAIPVDANGDGAASDDERLETKQEAVAAVATGKYPSPPARVLNLVTKGKPSPLVGAFIKWILTDGQKFVDEAGYVQLPADVLQDGVNKLQ